MATKKNLLAQIDKKNEQISTSPIIKGLIDGGLSLIPFLGSAISSSLDTRAFQLFEENSRIFTEEIGQLISNIDEDKVDKNFLETPEFTSLLIEILAHNARTHDKEKVKLFAKVFAGFSTNQWSKFNFKEGFIRIIDELSIEHIKVLAFIYDRTKHPIETDDELKDRVRSKEIAAQLNITVEKVQAYCDQMIRYGLLRDWSIGKFGYTLGNYAITGYGIEFSKLLIFSVQE